MFRKVMVPLDGSKVAEEALQVLDQRLACGQVSEAILARVERPAADVALDYLLPADVVAAANERTIEEARHYLEETSRSIEWNGVAHRSVAMLGDPAPTLSQLAEREGVDLVLTAVEKRRGLRGLLSRGADRLLRAFTVPVLVLGQPAERVANPWPVRLMKAA